MMKGAFCHEGHEHDEFDIHFPDHHVDVDGAADEDERSETWDFDNVELRTVGVDVGSSTSHLLFAHLHLQRLVQSLSSRFVVVERKVLHRSPILLTPYRSDGLIDIDALEQFVLQAYADAGMERSDVDTGAVILTGAALERANARAVADLFAEEGGKFVCASAGHNLEGILAAHGSGAVSLSRKLGATLLHMDVGGGTAKVALVHNGEVVQTSAVHVGGRLVAFDEHEQITRIEPSAVLIAEELGIPLALGERLPADERRRMARALADILLDAANGRQLTGVSQQFWLTEPLSFDGHRPNGVTFSGGVAEYIFGREPQTFGDLALDLAQNLADAGRSGGLPAEVLPLGEGIRATVLGASQFSVQLSGSTIHISDTGVLPLRNLPVIYARLSRGDPQESVVADAIRQGFRRLDLQEGDHAVALALPWRGEPSYQSLRALAGGIANALPRSIEAGMPLVVALAADVGWSLGGILSEELGVTVDLVTIDGLDLVELDYVDVGEMIQPANVVPVVVKSLAFPGAAAAHEAAKAVIARGRASS
jgi:ethanolamine utilization protein EutA